MIDYFKQIMLDSGTDIGYDDSMSRDSNSTPHPLFIAMSGKKQVGKDTAVEIATNMLRSSSKCVGVTAFAEVLKDIGINVLGLDESLVYGSNDDKETKTHILWDNFPDEIRLKYQKYHVTYSGAKIWHGPRSGPMTIREVLQVIGTDVFREMFDTDVWANAPFRRNWNKYDVVFITDCRFPNEKRVTEENLGLVVRIERCTNFIDNHPSETALDDVKFDICYQNNGTVDELRDFMRDLLKKQKLL